MSRSADLPSPTVPLGEKNSFLTSFSGNLPPGLFLALLVGGFFRLYAPITHNFPLGDGGLFVVTAQAIRENHFALPATVFYPTVGDTIPMCYPPLSFYEVAFLNWLGVPIETSMRLLPALWSVASIYAFWRLARAFFSPHPHPERTANVATLLWALLPWTFLWQVMGGGITRSPGLFWGLLGMEASLRLWRDKEQKYLPWLALFLAAALLTHLQQARFLIVSLSLIALFYDRSWQGLKRWLLVIFIGVLLASPWWGLCLSRFGLSPFLASMQSGGSSWQRSSLVNTVVGSELLLPFISFTGFIGFWVARRQLLLLPLWFVMVLLVEVRSPRLFITIPLALSAGFLLFQIKSLRLRYSVLFFLAAWGVLQSALIAGSYKELPLAQRSAMDWVNSNTPTNARFLVVPAGIVRKDWANDLTAEWFPALAKRHSVITVQGSEWLPNHQFKRLWDDYSALAKPNDWPSFRLQAQQRGLHFDYIFLPKSAPGPTKTTRFLQNMEQGLERSHQFSRIFSNQDASIWQRRLPASQ